MDDISTHVGSHCIGSRSADTEAGSLSELPGTRADHQRRPMLDPVDESSRSLHASGVARLGADESKRL